MKAFQNVVRWLFQLGSNKKLTSLRSPIKNGGTTAWSDQPLVSKQQNIALMPFNEKENINKHGVAFLASVLFRRKIVKSDENKVIILTLSCRLTKKTMREHIAGVKPSSNGTGSSKKGANCRPYSVLIYKINI